MRRSSRSWSASSGSSKGRWASVWMKPSSSWRSSTWKVAARESLSRQWRRSSTLDQARAQAETGSERLRFPRDAGARAGSERWERAGEAGRRRPAWSSEPGSQRLILISVLSGGEPRARRTAAPTTATRRSSACRSGAGRSHAGGSARLASRRYISLTQCAWPKWSFGWYARKSRTSSSSEFTAASRLEIRSHRAGDRVCRQKYAGFSRCRSPC
mmetsp:Transcript_17435/g.53147  ORF Transcript_17435/g.53147 Transcript_17435/m.53147 type:complete len:214 (-) Transcript_17435:1459-2100(-)